MLDKKEQMLADEEFRDLCLRYKDDKDSAIWDRMWELVYQACGSMVKTLLRGVKVRDLDELILDATLGSMNKIKKEFDKNGEFVLKYKLVTFVRSYCLYPVYKPSRKFNDHVISLDTYLENHPEEDIIDI